jgi:energy-coupling factor transport system substrate-specific component
MFATGWIGLTAGWLPRLASPRQRLVLLAAFGALWGFLFGAIMNLWFWPLTAPGIDADTGLYWQPGIGLAETLDRYLRFYLTTSFTFDLLRGIANSVLILFLGGPVLRLLERYRSRFTWQPWQELRSFGECAAEG